MEVYDVKHFIAIGKGEGTEEEYKYLAVEFFKKIVDLPTKYDLFSQTQYILPQEILPHTSMYSKETVFPRSRVLPEEAPMSKWEQFAKMKGIKKNKNKRGGRIYNEETRDFTPAYGRGSKNDLDRNWLIEIKDHEDPMVDRHKELRRDKKDRKKKQVKSEIENLKRTNRLSHFQKEKW